MWRYRQLPEADYPCLAVWYICASHVDRRDARVLIAKRGSPAGQHATDAADAPAQGTLEPTEDLRTKRGTTSIFKQIERGWSRSAGAVHLGLRQSELQSPLLNQLSEVRPVLLL